MNNFNQLISKIKWGYSLKKPYIDVPSFSLGKRIIKYLTKSGFISGYEIKTNKNYQSDIQNINISKIKINNIKQLKTIYSKVYNIKFIKKFNDEQFLFFLQENDINSVKYFKGLSLIPNISIYIITPKINQSANKLIYFNKSDIYNDLNWITSVKFNYIRIFLKYNNNLSTIKNIISLALPNRFFFWTVENMLKAPQSKKLRIKNLIKFRSKFVRMRINYILSTSKGIMSLEDAILANLGGKVLFKIYS